MSRAMRPAGDVLRAVLLSLVAACAPAPAAVPGPPAVSSAAPPAAEPTVSVPASPPATSSSIAAPLVAPETPPVRLDAAARAELASFASAFFGRFSTDGRRKIHRFGKLETDMGLRVLRTHVDVQVGSMEWHGNHVGDRWLVGHSAVCRDCEGHVVERIELFDRRVSLLVVGAQRPRPAQVLAIDICEAARAGVPAGLSSEPCSCRDAELPDDMEAAWLPTATREETPCEPGLRAATTLREATPHAWGAAGGTIVVDGSGVHVALLVTGTARRAFFEATSAAARRMR